MSNLKGLLEPQLKPKVVPARSKIAVNKSVISLGKRQSTNLNKKNAIGDGEKLDEVFAETLEIAVALLPVVPFMYSTAVRKWISKLLEPSLPKPKRNSHLSFLVFQMQNMKISDPFDKEPPQNLNDAGKVFTGAKMKAMMEETENKNLMEHLKEGLTPHGLSSFRADFKSPVEFFDDQPVPKNGLVAYGGCFSNHFY